MKRATLLLLGLGAILVVVVWYLLLFSPASDELTAIEDEIVALETQQATVRARIAELEGVRELAPQLQAELASAESLLPRDTALPAALRQLQQAADDSGATLVSVAPTRPALVDGQETLYQLDVNVQLRGAYFQIVDVLRRLEDPAISPRGLTWRSGQLAVEEYPTLNVTLSGRMFAVLPAPPAPPAEPDPETDTPDDDADVEVEADVEVDE